MKITIRKLGVIEEANIDLKPLTVFIGPNNAGKTWLAYAISGIVGRYGWDKYTQAYADERLPKEYVPLDEAIENVITQGNATIDLYKFAQDYGEKYFQNVADFACQWMQEFMSTQYTSFHDLSISVNIAKEEGRFLKHIEDYSLQKNIAGGVFTIRKKQGEKVLFAYTSTAEEEQVIEKIPDEEIKERLVREVALALRRSLYHAAHTFPTERTTLVTFRFGSRVRGRELPPVDERALETIESIAKGLQQLQELSGQNPRLLIEQRASRAVIGPVNTFINMLRYIFDVVDAKQIRKRKEQAEHNSYLQRYIELAQLLENEVLVGGIDFSTPAPDPKRDILFQPSENVVLEVPIASSMVKELSPLVLYLRHIAQPNELLVIDEPEMNLHPEAQAKIIEFLAMLVNAGLNVLFTTHSPYITDHLANLIKAAESDDQEAISQEFYLKRKEAFISREKVSVYGVDKGEVKNILDEDGMINWNTFGQVSERISEIYFRL